MCRRGSGLGRVFSRSPGSPGPKLGSGFSNSGLDIGPGSVNTELQGQVYNSTLDS